MNTRIGVRISADVREAIDKKIAQGQAKNLSEFIKKAIEETLETS